MGKGRERQFSSRGNPGLTAFTAISSQFSLEKRIHIAHMLWFRERKLYRWSEEINNTIRWWSVTTFWFPLPESSERCFSISTEWTQSDSTAISSHSRWNPISSGNVNNSERLWHLEHTAPSPDYAWLSSPSWTRQRFSLFLLFRLSRSLPPENSFPNSSCQSMKRRMTRRCEFLEIIYFRNRGPEEWWEVGIWCNSSYF